MRQRNDTGYALSSPDVGRVLYPGEEFSYPQHVTGCTDLDGPADTSGEAAAPEKTPESPGAPALGPAPKPKTTTGSEGEVA